MIFIWTPDLGIGANRNAVIINQLLGREVYRIANCTAFQTYGIPEDALLDQ